MEQDSKTIREAWAISEKRQFCKQSCTKISQGLEKLDPRSGERAIWELFQNARDIARKDNDGKIAAHIRMTITPDEFIFAHQGKAFTHDTFGSLIKQVSSECKENEDAVGQYGTGFLTTHAFGRKIVVNGSLDMEEQAPGKFVNIDGFVIDRTFTNITDFVDKMARQLVALENYADAPKIDTCKEWTELRYQLESAENALSKVQVSIEAAIKVMPYVLTINIPIIDVEIIDTINNKQYYFRKEEMPMEQGLNVMGIFKVINGIESIQKIYYLQSEDKEDIVIMPLKDSNTAQSLEGIAKLFVFFPLLGTEEFGMDFVFHSKKFYPVEERDAIHLPVENSNVREKYEKNVNTLKSMTDMLFEYIRNNASRINGWVEILRLNFECMRNKEDKTNNFFKEFKSKWVDFYENLNVFNIKGEYMNLKSSDIRLLSSSLIESFENEQKEYFDDVFDSIYEFALLPEKHIIKEWSKVVLSWKDSSSSCFLKIKDIAKIVSEHPNFSKLHTFCLYLKDMSQTELFDEYKLIPNRDNNLKYKHELNDASTIPMWLSDMIKPLDSTTVDKMISLEYSDVCSFTEFSRKNLADSITVVVRNLREKYLKNKECYPSEIIGTLIRLSCIFKKEGASSYRRNALPVICNHFGTEFKEMILEPIDSDERDLATLPFQHLVENMLLEISLGNKEWISNNYSYVLDLHKSLCKWSEYYDRNEKKGLAITYGAFPNQNNLPSHAKDLKLSLDIDDSELFELYSDAVGKDLNDNLVNRDFAELCEFETITSQDVASEIEEKLAEGGFNSDYVLDIIDKLEDEKWQKWFPRISEKKAELFMKQVKPECKDGVFKLMKINDPAKLNQLLELSENDNFDEILRLGEERLKQKRIENADFEYKKNLGEYIESDVRAQLSKYLSKEISDDENLLNVENEQYGHDLVVYYNNEPVYYLEIKSRWGSDQSVMMSPLQIRTSVEESENYALCCVDMTGYNHPDSDEHRYPAIEDTIGNIKCLPNIGSLNSELVKVSDPWNDDNIHIGGDFKAIVPQKVINTNSIDFESLVSTIASKIYNK